MTPTPGWYPLETAPTGEWITAKWKLDYGRFHCIRPSFRDSRGDWWWATTNPDKSLGEFPMVEMPRTVPYEWQPWP